MVHLHWDILQGTEGVFLVPLHRGILTGNCRPVVCVCVCVCAVGLVVERYGLVHIFGIKTFSPYLCISCTVCSAVYTYI
jgi:hypothetical protein